MNQLVLSPNSLNAIFTVCISFFGISISLFTLSVAFIVSGKESKELIRKEISDNGISISNRSKYIKNEKTTELMKSVAKYSAKWFVANAIASFISFLYLMTEIQYGISVVLFVLIIYAVISLFYMYKIIHKLYKWYRRTCI